ncbi:DUF5638 domain-containing protein [Legionella worsleiensis]|uniref:DUF5638 domain-containing protein n=2 Tax=Legionella worsleiensis TaxID=45076 RepID=A0A0W1AJT4_9GAMM|nr:hypothetical protein Lwor_0725 [Legionella worsleiensis]STY30161.1 Uncharacterised protein [Legionella worsleiensis]
MTLANKFKAVDKQFADFQHLLSCNTPSELKLNCSLSQEQQQIFKNVLNELQIIREFYHDRFYNKGIITQEEVIKQYSELHTLLLQLSTNTLSLDQALQKINTKSEHWSLDIIKKNILKVCYAVAFLIPVVAGVSLLAFVFPLMTFSLTSALILMVSGVVSLSLSLSKIWDNLSSVESTSSVKNNTGLEQSFLGNIHTLFGTKKDANQLIIEQTDISKNNSSEASMELNLGDYSGLQIV